MLDSPEIRRSLIEAILAFVNDTPQVKANIRAGLEKTKTAELNDLLIKAATENAQAISQSQDALLEARATRAAERAAFDLEHNAPKRQEAQKAQVDKDVATFAAAANVKRTVSVNQANYHLLVEAIGKNFSQEMAENFIETNGSTMMSAPSRHEMASWDHQDAQERKAQIAQQNEYKKNLPDEQLRALVKQEGQQAHAAAAQVHAQQQIQVREQRDAQVGFPPLPTHNAAGEALDGPYFIKLSNSPHGSDKYELWRRLVHKHGFAAINRRLNGLQ